MAGLTGNTGMSGQPGYSGPLDPEAAPFGGRGAAQKKPPSKLLEGF